MKSKIEKLIGFLLILCLIFAWLFSGFPKIIKKPPLPPEVKKAQADYQFSPVSGNLVVGSETAIQAATAAAPEGVNVGSWKGTLGDDNLHWVVNSVGTGTPNLDVQLNTKIQLNGANILMIQTEFDLDSAILTTLIQICDWVSSTNVDSAADAYCTTGGWRTINIRKVALAPTTAAAYHWQIYDGYWSDGSNNAVSTPLTNFVSGSNPIKIRYYSDGDVASNIAIDYLRIYAVINPVYTAGGFANEGSGTVTGEYTYTTVGFTGTTNNGSDDTRLQVAGTAGTVADFRLSFKNVQTYIGMNTILVRAEYSCSGTDISHRPKIYNFTTLLWEDLTTASIVCSATDATNVWAKNNITMTDYVSAGEIRVGFYGLANSTTALRIDYIYVMLGTTNSDVAQCEISFGTNSAGDCSNTRNIDMTGSASTWNILTEDELATFGHTFYPYDNDGDAIIEEAGASHVKYSVIAPSNAAVTGIFFAGRFMSGTGGTVQMSLRDYSGFDYSNVAAGIYGNFTRIGATSTTALTYTDNMTVGGIGSGGPAGVMVNPEDYPDTVNNQMETRLETTASGATTNNSINQWDFAMVSLQWTEDANHPSEIYQFTPASQNLIIGSDATITSATTAALEGVNVGSWKGTLGDDNFHWVVNSVAVGTPNLDAQLNVVGVQLNNANTLMIETEFDLDSATLATVVQICDWVSSTNVDNAADAQCTTGGWRTLNNRKVTIVAVAGTAYHWQIYDGFWTDGSNNSISTPLTNFISGSTVKIRYYSDGDVASNIAIDYLRIFAVINPVYTAGGFANEGSGTVTGEYRNTFAGISNIGVADTTYLQVAGTAGTVADFRLSFKNVQTYTGMNTILVRASHSCSAATVGLYYRPKIYNFTTLLWEDLSTASITCSATDYVHAWAKNNVTISDYISGGEIRVGFYGLPNSYFTTALRIDYIYIMLGTTNTDVADCGTSFGTNALSTDCSDTRGLDMTGALSSWKITPEDESNTLSHAFYALDNDADANVENAVSAHIKFPVTAPTGAVTGIFFASSHLGAATYNTFISGTQQMEIFDYSGLTGSTLGGFVLLGAASNIAWVYTDNVTVGTFTAPTSGGVVGYANNPEDFVDTINNQMWVRLRTLASNLAGSSIFKQWNFMMVSLQWIEPAVPPANQPPTIGEVSLNSKQNINLIENSQIDIIASASVTDADGCSDISGVKAIVYHYSTYTASCSNDQNNCYDEDQFNCVTDGACVGNTQEYNCYASSSMQFFADPTDAGSSFSSDEWVVSVIASDSVWQDVSSYSYDDNDETPVEVNELTALEVTSGDPINYGEVIAGQNTGAVNQTLTAKNTGNKGIDVMVYGTNLTGICGTITVGNQQYTSTSFTYNDYGKTLLATPGERYYNGGISWIKPTSSTPITNNIYWGINVSEGTATGVCSGTNTFSATSEQ